MLGLSLIQRIVGGLVISILLSLSIALFFADRRADKWERQAVRANAELRRMADASERQMAETERRLAEAKARIVTVDRTVTELETREVPGQCATPDKGEWEKLL